MTHKLELDLFAHEHWRFLPGMRVTVQDKHNGRYMSLSGYVINANDFLSICTDEHGIVSTRSAYDTGLFASSIRPDLSSPATIGCILQLVREVRNAPMACLRYDAASETWEVEHSSDEAHSEIGRGDTAAEALLSALDGWSEQDRYKDESCEPVWWLPA